MEKAPDFYKSRAFRFGGLGRNRTTDTRIFNLSKIPCESTANKKRPSTKGERDCATTGRVYPHPHLTL